MNFKLIIIVSLILFIFLMFFTAWSKAETVSGSVTPGFIIWVTYFLYGIFWILLSHHYDQIKSTRDKFLILLSVIPFVTIPVICLTIYYQPQNILIIKNEIYYLIGQFIIILILFVITIKLKEKNIVIKTIEIIVVFLVSYSLMGITFAFLYYVDDEFSRIKGEGGSFELRIKRETESVIKALGQDELYFQEASIKLKDKSEKSKLDLLITLIVIQLKKGFSVNIEIDSYADKQVLLVPNDIYPSNYELTVERANVIKNYFLIQIQKKMHNLNISNHLNFIETRHSSEESQQNIFEKDRKVILNVYYQYSKFGDNQPMIFDYFLFSFYSLTSTSYEDIKPITKSTKFLYNIETAIVTICLTIIVTLLPSLLNKNNY